MWPSIKNLLLKSGVIAFLVGLWLIFSPADLAHAVDEVTSQVSISDTSTVTIDSSSTVIVHTSIESATAIIEVAQATITQAETATAAIQTQATAITSPIRNNTNFIKTLFPTITDDLIQFQIGDMYSVKKLSLEVVNTAGALVYKKETGYQNGSIPLRNLAAGTYVVTITSNDRKYQFTRKIIKR